MERHLRTVGAEKPETAAQRGRRRLARMAELRSEESILLLRMAKVRKEEAKILADIAEEGATLETGRPPRKSPRPQLKQNALPDELTREALEEVERILG